MLEPLVVLAVVVAPMEQVKLVALAYQDKAMRVVLVITLVAAVVVAAQVQ